MCINRRGNLLLGTFDVRLQVEDCQVGGKKVCYWRDRSGQVKSK